MWPNCSYLNLTDWNLNWNANGYETWNVTCLNPSWNLTHCPTYWTWASSYEQLAALHAAPQDMDLAQGQLVDTSH